MVIEKPAGPPVGPENVWQSGDGQVAQQLFRLRL